MPYFSRLTDIVSCDLTSLLAEAPDPSRALQEIIAEMEEGVAGAGRWVENARANEQRLRDSIVSQEEHAGDWADHARDHLLQGAEGEARRCLLIKKEHDDLVAGLSQQLEAAVSARENCLTQLRALEAKLADSRRRWAAVERGEPIFTPRSVVHVDTHHGEDRLARANAELEALKKELGVA